MSTFRSSLVAAVAVGALSVTTNQLVADCEICLPTFTHVPDFIISGQGSCWNDGIGPGGGPPSDVLEITVPPDPKCEGCTVTVTADWGTGMDTSQPKGPGTVGGENPFWPHRV